MSSTSCVRTWWAGHIPVFVKSRRTDACVQDRARGVLGRHAERPTRSGPIWRGRFEHTERLIAYGSEHIGTGGETQIVFDPGTPWSGGDTCCADSGPTLSAVRVGRSAMGPCRGSSAFGFSDQWKAHRMIL